MPSIQHRGVGWALRALRVNSVFASPESLQRSLGSPPRLGAAPTPPSKLRRDFRCQPQARQPGGGAESWRNWPVWELTPRTFLPTTTVIYFHGGAYVREAISQHWGLVEQLLREVPARVVFPRYPLAPGTHPGPSSSDPEAAPTPSSAEATVTGAAGLIAHWAAMVGAGEVVVMGDSAGAGLALAAVQHLRDIGGGGGLPRQLVLISPWLDVTMSDPEQAALERGDPILGRAGLAEAGRIYAAELGVEHPFASPLFGSMTDLPPLTVLASTGDLLLPDARRLVAAARAAGVDVDYDEQPGLFHDFALLPVPEGGAARALLVAACRP